MIDRDQAEQLLEQSGHVFARSGVDVGPVSRIFLDEYTGWPSFCTVTVSDDQTDSARQVRETFVALHEGEIRDGAEGINVPYDAAKVSGGPTVGAEDDLSIAEEDALFAYYGVPVDGVVPVVEHLGSVLITTGYENTEVVEQDVDHPAS